MKHCEPVTGLNIKKKKKIKNKKYVEKYVVKLLVMFFRITKISSYQCLWCMAKQILAKGQPKVKWGQIFNNVGF